MKVVVSYYSPVSHGSVDCEIGELIGMVSVEVSLVGGLPDCPLLMRMLISGKSAPEAFIRGGVDPYAIREVGAKFCAHRTHAFEDYDRAPLQILPFAQLAGVPIIDLITRGVALGERLKYLGEQPLGRYVWCLWPGDKVVNMDDRGAESLRKVAGQRALASSATAIDRDELGGYAHWMGRFGDGRGNG